MSYIDLFSSQSSLYAEFRPTYPAAIFDYLAGLAPARRIALDLAAGSGQASCDLQAHFERVFAADVSPAQLAHARCADDPHSPQVYPYPHEEAPGRSPDGLRSSEPGASHHIRAGVAAPRQAEDRPLLRFVAPAERLPLPSACLDLITVAQAVHWFDFPAFYAEARRVLRRGGLLAVWTYHLPRFNPAVDAVVDHLFTAVTGSYWHPRRALVDDGYASLPFPFDPLPPPPATEIVVDWTLPNLIGFILSWSASQAFQAANRRSPLASLEADLLAAWGAPETPMSARFPLAYRIGRVN